MDVNKLKKDMWRICVIFFGATAMLACTKSVDEVAGCEFPKAEEMRLVWSDEFDGMQIDMEKWSYDTANGCQFGQDLCGWGNNELQYYTDRSENSYIEDGKLVIEAKEENYENPGELGFDEYDYTSARMVTKNKGDWRFGRIEVRAKIPTGKGMWPAIWMLPTDTVYGTWPKSGEIDIMEARGSNTREVIGTIHYGNEFWEYNDQYFRDTLETGERIDFANDFHIYSAVWTEQCIQFYVDGKKLGNPNTRSTTLPQTWPFDQPFHLILNVAVGGNYDGDPDASTQFPQTMEVDYVRVYQEN